MSDAIKKVKVATVWLDGCSGCHMSFLDIDERLITLAGLVDVVYSPLVDRKDFPEQVDVTIVEGAVSTDEDMEKMIKIRKRTKLLIALGDCAVTGNVPAMRNGFGSQPCFDRAYVENATVRLEGNKPPSASLPVLLERVRPIHEVVKIDVHIPGCPPPADAIYHVLTELLAGRTPDIAAVTRFGR